MLGRQMNGYRTLGFVHQLTTVYFLNRDYGMVQSCVKPNRHFTLDAAPKWRRQKHGRVEPDAGKHGPDGQMTSLQQALGVKFKDITILRQALLHPSITASRLESNQRLEFLGDAVLGCVVAEKLYEERKGLNEGELTLARQNLVSTAALAEIALEQGYDKLLFMSFQEEGYGGRGNVKILADTVEAVIGAVFVDQGYQCAQMVIERLYKTKFAKMETSTILTMDPISSVMNFSKQLGLEPCYKVVKEGVEHAPKFTVHLSLNGHPLGWGTGRSSKDAKYAASQYALKLLESKTKQEIEAIKKPRN
mmetsp:Transcript_6750/g.23728  ORF Transcript_6750/g.23728 Transcript_6750/m.23728 type:complete len:305 (+) Transcript_6750:164-1078(+)